MEQYIIKGGTPLVGEVVIGGAKNAALGILAAAIMTDGQCLIDNMPNVRDTNVLLQAMEQIGATVVRKGDNEVLISGKYIDSSGELLVDNEYIRKIRECNDAIPGEAVSEKMYRMELLTKRIFERVEQDPDSVEDIRKLMEYYLPTAVKLLEAYEKLDAQPVQGENILSSKKEIEDTLDTLNIAFEKLLDDLFQETAWDVSSDISVLKTMLAQEGLTGKDFETGGKR